jgi:hypothetical protein
MASVIILRAINMPIASRRGALQVFALLVALAVLAARGEAAAETGKEQRFHATLWIIRASFPMMCCFSARDLPGPSKQQSCMHGINKKHCQQVPAGKQLACIQKAFLVRAANMR